MQLIRKKKLLYSAISLGIIILFYTIMVFLRGPFQFEQMDVSGNQIVGETESNFNNYSIKVFYKSGPIGYYEYSFIGSLYQGENFIRNVFWVGPSGNDFTIDWASEDTIKINNLTRSTPSVTLDVEEDIYDFRGFPL